MRFVLITRFYRLYSIIYNTYIHTSLDVDVCMLGYVCTLTRINVSQTIKTLLEAER